MPDAGAAREQAREILSQKRYQPSHAPRPLKKPLDWLGDRLDDVGNWFARRIDDLDGVVPGGKWVVWILLAGAVGAIAYAAAQSALSRRSVSGVGRGAPRAARVDPAELEREADAAERAGDFERAVRLRFRAGVLRLEFGAGETTGGIGAALGSELFDRLGDDHDAIAYGGRAAAGADAEAARRDWPRVVKGAR